MWQLPHWKRKWCDFYSSVDQDILHLRLNRYNYFKCFSDWNFFWEKSRLIQKLPIFKIYYTINKKDSYHNWIINPFIWLHIKKLQWWLNQTRTHLLLDTFESVAFQQCYASWIRGKKWVTCMCPGNYNSSWSPFSYCTIILYLGYIFGMWPWVSKLLYKCIKKFCLSLVEDLHVIKLGI